MNAFRLILQNPWAPMLLVFGTASVVAVAMVVARWFATGQFGFLYLPWNLFLAWIPLGLALLTRRWAEARPQARFALGVSAFGWLVFFPNAPYILTDLMHLVTLHPGAPAPLWFDLLLNLTFAMTGLLLGFASLALMQELVRRSFGGLAGWLFAGAALTLSSLGIYLGRFLRWHSWDVVLAPVDLGAQLWARVADPLRHPRTVGFTLICSAFLLLSYLMCRVVAGLRPRLPVNLDADVSRS